MVRDGAAILRDPKELLDNEVETRKISTRKNLVVFFPEKSVFLNTLNWKSLCVTGVKNIDVQLHSQVLVMLMFVRKHPR